MPAGAKRIANRTLLLEGIQVLRAIAALMVVMHHSLEESMAAVAPIKNIDSLTTFGAAGVDIFFVISGFIMFHVSFPTNRPAASPTSFLARRITRIYPFYWFCAALVLGLWSIGFFHSLQMDANTLIRSLLLYPSEHLIINVSWTLVYEMYFYLIFAATLIYRRPLVSLFGTCGAILILYAIGRFTPDPAVRDFLNNAIALEFCFGLILAYLFQHWPKLSSAAGILWIPGFALLFIAALVVPHATTNGLPDPTRVLVWGIPAALVVLSFLSLRPSRGPLRRVMVLLGDASYAIYLTHPLVMIIYARLLKGSLASLSQLPIIPFVVLLSASFGLLLHLFIEQRLIEFFRGLFEIRSASRRLPQERSRPNPLP
jgi:exopolysaccharide production protein ExoZ